MDWAGKLGFYFNVLLLVSLNFCLCLFACYCYCWYYFPFFFSFFFWHSHRFGFPCLALVPCHKKREKRKQICIVNNETTKY